MPVFDTQLIMAVFQYAAVIITGLSLGSFAGCAIYREPLERPWLFAFGGNEKRSACMSCGIRLTALDLVPVVSWLCSRGKCRHCGAAVSRLYPVVEILTSALMVLALYVLGWGADMFFFCAVIWALTALLVIDIRHMLLPNTLVAIVFIGGVMFQLFRCYVSGEITQDLLLREYALAALIYPFFIWLISFVMEKAMKKEVMGMGDVKFFAAAGIWLGLTHFAPFCFFAGIVGILFGIIWRIFIKEAYFPFGPALIVVFYILFLMKQSGGSSFLL